MTMSTEGPVGSSLDISKRKNARQALEISQAAIDSSLDAICLGDLDGTLTYVNDRFVQMWGFENKREVLGQPAAELWADRERAEQALGALWEQGTWTGENRGRRADGREIDVRLVANIVRDKESGEPLAWMSSLQDVTQQKITERALRLTQHAVDTSSLSTALVDVEGRFTYVNDAFLKLWGYDEASEVLGKSSLEQFEDQEWARGETQNLAATGSWSGKGRARRRDGSEFDLETRGSIVRDDETGEPIAFLLTGQDVTERERATEALRESEGRLRVAQDLVGLGYAWFDIDERVFHGTPEVQRLLRLPDDARDLDFDTLFGQYVHPEDHKKFAASLTRLMQGQTDVEHFRFRWLPPEGGVIHVANAGRAERDESGRITRIFGVGQDITELVRTEEAVRESEMLTRRVMENAAVGIITLSEKGMIQTFNPMAEQLFGYKADEVIGQNVKVLMPEPYRSEHDRYIERYEETGVGQILGVAAREVVGLRKDGLEFPMELSVAEMWVDDKRTYIGCALDITASKDAQEQLRQAQKMEAVGRLTGGVAHDFNNLLGVIMGNAGLLRKKIGDHRHLAGIDHATKRGAELTQRLLAFSRTQTLAPQPIDLAELVPGLHDLLLRTLGEPVKIVMDVPEGLWPIMADPGQLENALLNLSINARDAMPDGGTLEIVCSNIELQDGNRCVSHDVAAGDYVQIAIRDSGLGIPEDVLERVFEPFYTTKEVGKGTGLGLSMVHGFARQSGGDAVIESELGKGTEVSLFLPRAAANAASDEPMKEQVLKHGQGETILVLEDDPGIRSLAVDALEELGYQVLEAADAKEAMQALEKEQGNVNLLLSDVVLPGGVSGPEAAATAMDLYPKLKVLFMSGYTAGLDAHHKIPDFAEKLLSKPFDLTDLAGAVRKALAA